MVIKVYISGISASKEIKKRQQRALLILDSCKVDYESIDITEPGFEEMREFMVQNSKIREPNKTPLSPQFFNDDVYCGDYEDFDSAVEVNEVFPFLKLESNGADFQYSFNNINMKTTNGDHEKDDIEKSENMDNEQKEEDGEGEVIKGDADETGDAEKKGEEEEEEEEEEAVAAAAEEEDDDFWAQDDSKKRKKEEDEVVEETKESNEDANETEDATKRLKTDDEEEKEDAEVEEEEQTEPEEVKPDAESEKVEEKKAEETTEGDEEEEDDDFWAGKGD